MLTTKHILIFYLLTECQYILLYPIDQYFEDWGQCIPIKCINGEPPENCTTLCSSANLQTTCRPKTDFCLCLKPAGNGRWDLVSPDEVATLFNLTDTNRDNHTDASKINQTDSSTETDSDDVSVETFSATIFGFFTYIIPFPVLDAPDQNETIYFEELPPENKGVTGTDKEVTDSKKEATDSKKEMPDEGKENVEREELLNEVVNVHEGYYECFKGIPSLKCRSECANKSMDTLCSSNGKCFCRFKDIIAEHTCIGDVPTEECRAECERRRQQPYCSVFNKFCYCEPSADHVGPTLSESQYDHLPIPIQWDYFVMNAVLVYVAVVCLYVCCRQTTLKKVFR